MPLKIIQGNILDSNADIIVNAANQYLQMGGGVCGEIFRRANPVKLTKACDEIGFCNVGSAIATEGFELCKYIIHAVGPIYQGGDKNEEQLLMSSYQTSLTIAEQLKCESIAFPIISSGIYGYPKTEAFSIACQSIGQYLKNNDSDLEVELYIYSYPESFVEKNWELENEIHPVIESYACSSPSIKAARKEEKESHNSQLFHFGFLRKEDIVEEETVENNPFCEPLYEEANEDCYFEAVVVENSLESLQDELDHMDRSFSEMVLNIIDENHWRDPDVYHRANISRKVFSKLRTDDNYQPSKTTALALAIGLKLNLEQTNELLEKAGYTLSRSNMTDIIVSFYIRKKIYDIYEVNSQLVAHGQKCLC